MERLSLKTRKWRFSNRALYPDPIELLGRFASLDSWNFSQWENINFQQVVQQAWCLPQSTERDLLLKTAEEMLLQDAPFIPIANHVGFYMCHPTLKGFVFSTLGCVDFTGAYFDE